MDKGSLVERAANGAEDDQCQKNRPAVPSLGYGLEKASLPVPA